MEPVTLNTTHLHGFVKILDDCCDPLVRAVQAGEHLNALGLRRSARLPVLSVLQAQLARPMLLITDRSARALALAEELALWTPNINLLPFPEPAPLFYEDAEWGETTRRDRLKALTTLAAYHIPTAERPENPPLIIAPARAIMTRSLPRRDLLRATQTLKREQVIQIDELARACLMSGYEIVNMVISPGRFARRGGIIDLWPPAERYPVRLEFFGDEIDTLRYFDPATQRTIKSGTEARLERLLLTPAREFIIRPDSPPLEEDEHYSEFHIPRLHLTPASVLDYLPREGMVIIDDRQALEDTISEIEEQALTRKAEQIRDGTLSEDFPTPYLGWTEIQDILLSHQTLDLGYPYFTEVESPLLGASTDETPGAHLADRFEPGPRFGGRLKTLLEHIGERRQAGHRIVIVSRQAARLQELWQEQRPSPTAGPVVTFIENSLAEGWIFHPHNAHPVHLLTDGEIFGWRRPEPRRRARPVAEAPESSYTDLEIGDYVVHIDHGIGRFVGLVERTVEGISREYLCVEYEDDAQLFVPVHQADRLTRYIGADGRPPRLSRLGSPSWRNVKSHVKEAVQEVAEDLLELYATRSVVKGYAFGQDQSWQQELEASFPYVETDDQMRVLAEVKEDMESDRPMDRLICGDVGYGKTEVALRSAFKAVLDGKQVAILVPTTVLAQQHFNTFRQRLAAFPVQVEMLSRFRTPQEQREIISRLIHGSLDIVIGTHRLLSSDVEFKDLGLLIIDEEQRFGVTHKEALKKMRTEVDVLTLTATPIPRTLYMALSGVRDISTMTTPPEERLPIVTHVGPYSPKLVRQAILREIERGGQVFFVHNRVQTIEAMQSHLRQIMPEARITVAHGQMKERDLSARMQEFSSGEVDVLLSTSIIESGLDIPNANTLIVDRADTFGLAQLYQLRGRVGRGAQRAYAYFFRHRRKSPTIEGRMRLETIAENTQLGAGFSIAMRDLEIRGAGDILGSRQHGHIAAVGFHLYTSLLAEAVRRLRKQRGLQDAPTIGAIQIPLTPVNVELPLPVNIPSDYVPDKGVRLGLYRRIANIRTLAELDALTEEFEDRFGPPPEMTLNLFFQLKLRLLAESAGLASINMDSGQLALRYPDIHIPDGLPHLGPHVRLGKTALWMAFKDLEDWRSALVDVLERLQEDENRKS